MTSPILVTGGTGTLGRLVVRRLRDAGRDVRVLSRSSHEAEDGIQHVTGDLATGKGIEPAVEGTEIIVHLAGSAKGDEVRTRNLMRTASRAGARMYEMTELLRGYLRASRKHWLIVPVRLPGTEAHAFRAGANLASDRAGGRRTWEKFLAERLSGEATDSLGHIPRRAPSA